MSEFTSFVERPEKVEAFKFVGPHQVEQVLDAFEVPHDNWTLTRTGKSYSLTFPKKAATAQFVPVSDQYGILYNGTVTIGSPDTGRYCVSTGAWLVKRYIDTDHPEVTVLSDKEFRRKYRAQIEAA